MFGYGHLSGKAISVLGVGLCGVRVLICWCSVLDFRVRLCDSSNFRLWGSWLFVSFRMELLSRISGDKVGYFYPINIWPIMDGIFRFFRVKDFCYGGFPVFYVMERYGAGDVSELWVSSFRSSLRGFAYVVNLFNDPSARVTYGQEDDLSTCSIFRLGNCYKSVMYVSWSVIIRISFASVIRINVSFARTNVIRVKYRVVFVRFSVRICVA